MGKIYLVFSRLTLTFCLFATLTLTLNGQRTIHGKVTDARTSEGLIGTNVVVMGSVVGTVTDFDGSYSLDVPEGFDILSFNYTGYTSVQVKLADADVVDIALEQGKVLDEVILIGYGTVKREDVTGAVGSVSSDEFNKGAITGAQELLAGKIAGVVITSDDGAPGAGSTIRIRGESSLSATNNPLIVIDGVPVDNGGVFGARNQLSVINPNDIETFTVLKDASAAAIYGNRAAAGVVLITTKTGSVGDKVKIGYNGNISVGEAAKFVDALHADEYRAVINERYDSTHPARALLGDASTYWQDEIYQTAIGYDHNLYASGGIGDVPFRVSLGYTDKDGILKTDLFRRLTGGVNLNPGFMDNTLQVNFHFKCLFTNNHFADRGAIDNALYFDPTQAIYDSLSPYGGFTTWTISNGTPNGFAPTNPIAQLELVDDKSNETEFITNLSVDYRVPFLPALRANLNLANDYTKGEGTYDVPTYASFAYDALTGGGIHSVYRHTKKNNLLEFYLNYKTVLDQHSVDLMAGYSWQHFEDHPAYRFSDAAGTPSETITDTFPAELFLLSYYGRLTYSYNDRCFLTFSLRRDGTSRFAPDNRWGLFPALAVAYKVFDNDKSSFNSLKVRAGWGLTGQQDIGDYYAYLARYQISFDNARYQFGDDFINTFRPNGYDENIKWEETKTINIGVDFSIIKNRFTGSLDVYKRYTKDLLNRIPVPAGTNLSNFITTNVGNMENQGVELSLFFTPVLSQKVKWELGTNLAYNKNEITKLTATNDPTYAGVLTGSIYGGYGSNIQIHSAGYPPRSFYVYEQLYDDNGRIIENSFVDRNGDGIVNGLDKYRFEKPTADYTIGFSNRLEIANFDFSFGGRASIGNYVYNNVQTVTGYLNGLYDSSGALWNINQSAIDNNVIEPASLTFSDHFVQKADWLKVDHITLGYTFDHLIGDFLRLAVTAQNPIIATSYDGLDPEIFNGIDINFYPRPSSFVFSLNAEF